MIFKTEAKITNVFITNGELPVKATLSADGFTEGDTIFLDEATNSLDAENERVIVENLNKFYKGRTVVVVAHRLSTVKDSDQIIVLDGGRICETGDHKTLIANKGAYYNLIKNQLELGN